MGVYYDCPHGNDPRKCGQCRREAQEQAWSTNALGCMILVFLMGAAIFPTQCGGRNQDSGQSGEAQPPTKGPKQPPTKPGPQNLPPKKPPLPDPLVPETPLIDPTPVKTDGGGVVLDGTLVLKSRAKIVAGATAWVEIDGAKKADWPVGTDEVRITVAPGSHKVEVYSIYQGVRRQIYSSSVVVSSGETKVISEL